MKTPLEKKLSKLSTKKQKIRFLNMPAKENIEMWRKEAEEKRKKTYKERFLEMFNR